MISRTTEISPRVYARVAGLAYILVILLGIVSVGLVESRLIVPGDDAATVNNIIANEFLYRAGIASELMMFVFVVMLSLALYLILRPVNEDLALAALFFRFGEAIIGVGVTVISGLIPLLLLDREASFEPGQLQAMVGLFLSVRTAGLNIVLIFVGLGGTLFCYLFFTSKYVPGPLAAWGIATYVSMLILAFLNILFPGRPAIIEVVLFSLGALFEVIFGFWLLIKGVNVQHDDPKNHMA